ncbi:MAG: helix-turn-helix domain-containing protein [Caulobacter sp.]|nr:helix-turn-helix domain-containing protein [Caulobacter sp.]
MSRRSLRAAIGPDNPDPSPWQRTLEVLGEAGGARLSRDFAGKRVYIPRQPGPDHALSVCLGHDQALILAEALAGEELEPPLTAGRRLRILELLAQGEKPERISHAVGVSRRYVFRLKKRVEDDEQQARQMSLF